MVYTSAAAMELAGKVALVTGGGRGIGAAVARRLARSGLRVAVLGRTLEPLEAVAREVDGLAVPADVTDRAALLAALGEVERAMGPVDVLVNNAGAAESAPLGRTTDAAWDEAF